MLQVFQEVNHDQQHQKGFRKSKNTAPIMSPLSILFNHRSMRFINAVLQECCFRNPDCDLSCTLYLFK